MVVGTRVAYSRLFLVFFLLLSGQIRRVSDRAGKGVFVKERESRAGDSGQRICVERGDGGGSGGGSTAREG